jgi:hypothetical protein
MIADSVIKTHRFLSLDGEIHQIFTVANTDRGRIHISIDDDSTIPSQEQITIRLYDNTEPPTPMKTHVLRNHKLDWPINQGVDRVLFQVLGWNGFKNDTPLAVWINVSVEHGHILNSPPNKPCVYWGDDENKRRAEVQRCAAVRYELERITKLQSKLEKNLDWSLYEPHRVEERKKALQSHVANHVGNRNPIQ